MATKLGRDRLRGLVDVIVESIDDWATGPDLAKRAYRSPGRVRQLAREGTPSLRSMLNRLVLTKEMWSAAISGRAFAADDDRTIPGMRRRLDASGGEFVEFVTDINKGDAWDTAFATPSASRPRASPSVARSRTLCPGTPTDDRSSPAS